MINRRYLDGHLYEENDGKSVVGGTQKLSLLSTKSNRHKHETSRNSSSKNQIIVDAMSYRSAARYPESQTLVFLA